MRNFQIETFIKKRGFQTGEAFLKGGFFLQEELCHAEKESFHSRRLYRRNFWTRESFLYSGVLYQECDMVVDKNPIQQQYLVDYIFSCAPS
jgi:hypothetical protein